MFRLSLFLPFLVSFLLQGCADAPPPVEPTNFVRSGIMSKDPTVPFQKAWWKQGVPTDQFTRVYIAPVHTENLTKVKVESPNELEQIKKDANALALDAQRILNEAFANDPRHRFRVVGYPGPGTLVIEFSLTEAKPHEVAVEAVSYAGGPLMGILGWAGGASVRNVLEDPISFEARIRNGGDEQVIAMFADRRLGSQTILNVRGLTRFGYVKATIKQWASQLTEVLSKRPEQIVREAPSFELKLW